MVVVVAEEGGEEKRERAKKGALDFNLIAAHLAGKCKKTTQVFRAALKQQLLVSSWGFSGADSLLLASFPSLSVFYKVQIHFDASLNNKGRFT